MEFEKIITGEKEGGTVKMNKSAVECQNSSEFLYKFLHDHQRDYLMLHELFNGKDNSLG